MAYIEKRKGRGGKLCYRIQVRHGRHKWSKTFYPIATKPAAIRAEVLREAARYEAYVTRGQYKESLSLLEYVNKRWIPAAQAELSLAQQEQYISVLSRIICPFLGHLTLEEITPRQVQDLVDKMAKDGLKVTSIKKYICALRSVIRHALDMREITEDPCRHIRYPRQQIIRRTHAWTPEQCQNFLDFIKTGYYRVDSKGRRYHETPDVKWYAFFLLALYGSFRRGEIVALRWSDIDFDDHTITIKRSVQKIKGQVIIKEPKTISSIRTISMPAGVIETLQMLPRKGDYVICRGGTVDPGGMLYPTSPSKQFCKFLNAYNSIHQANKLPVITLHDLRHTGATWLLESGIGIETVSRRLGHSKASVTLDVYGESMQRTDRTAAEKLDELLTHKSKEE